ncbi:LTA synthase family protein [Thermomonas sp.]|jgi:phosphoglycerol transferase MdoB-like AlkP superfamily enzyme|uniref:LTA synthase family protein n=1 Tax=Thermomonas sp. TaxID=1971895 RepID=UPI00257B90BF|nr:LTA synthase family protein [Thermomonas sp.]
MTQVPAARFDRFRPLRWLVACFLVISALTRLALLVATGSGVPAAPGPWLYAFGVGLGYDLLAALYFAWPLVLLLWLLPAGWLLRRRGRLAVGGLCLLLLLVLLFVAVAEWTFWDEFQARFNFIAVDYLVYTTEVIGNIRQSYPVGLILSAVAALALGGFFATRRWRRVRRDEAGFAARTVVVACWLAASALGTWLVSGEMKDRSDNAYVNELAGNGIYQFFSAYRSASLDYARYYRTVPIDEAWAQVRAQVATPDARFFGPTGIARRIHNAAPEQRMNVVLISVESLSADFSGTYGRKDSLTPRLDALTRDSLLFADLWATGTRTVRGLEALSLSVPPTPGESIVRREHNEGLATLGEVFRGKDYHAMFLYGGYGAFDDMNRFFSHNGYDVHDRTDIPDQEIHHENVWGVADEDLYSMAMKHFDTDFKAGKPFFAHLMTTSNHRPYTFPAGRGPWPQGKRESAVAYTDWAIGDFLRRASSKPWYRNTLFVITADHCASSAGIAALPAFRYRIPLWIYAPGGQVAPGRVERRVSQIDIAPTVLGILGMDYDSRFYGVDVFQQPSGRARAFIGTYQLLGYLRDDKLVQLSPHRKVDTLRPAYARDVAQPELAEDPALTLQAISAYQTATTAFADGSMTQAALEREARAAAATGAGSR